MTRTLNILWICLGLMAFDSAVWAAGPAGFVAAVRGEAEVIRGDQVVQARIGMRVLPGDVLQTKDKSRLKVLLSDDSVIALGSRSRVQLTDHQFTPAKHSRTTRLRLLGGSLRALVQKAVGASPADFEVRTGTAVAGVRGTEFALLDEGDRGLRLVTFSGGVEFSAGQGEPVLVVAGHASRLDGNGASAPEVLAAADLVEARQATDTLQAPQALAWNLSPADGDRLGRPVGKVPPAGEADRDPVEDGSGGTGLGGGPREGAIEDEAENSYTGAMDYGDDVLPSGIAGRWDQQPDNWERGASVRLTVRLND